MPDSLKLSLQFITEYFQNSNSILIRYNFKSCRYSIVYYILYYRIVQEGLAGAIGIEERLPIIFWLLYLKMISKNLIQRFLFLSVETIESEVYYLKDLCHGYPMFWISGVWGDIQALSFTVILKDIWNHKIDIY